MGPIKQVKVKSIIKRNQIVENNYPLLLDLAKQLAKRLPLSIDIQDLIQEGSVGLIRAAELYNKKRKIKFSTYATIWIKSKMGEYIRSKCNIIKIPHHQNSKIRRIKKGIPVKTTKLVDELMKQSMILLNSTISINDNLVEPFYDSETVNNVDTKLIVKKLLSTLTERERNIITSLYGIGKKKEKMKDIAASEHFTREWTRKIAKKAILKMSEYAQTENITDDNTNG